MNRRDFLLLRTEQTTRVAELSCERLYMHYQHSSVTMRFAASATSAALQIGEDEPPTVFVERTTRQLFSEVDHELRRADVLCVLDTQWLAVDAFRRHVEGLLSAFRRRGGRVEYGAT